MFQIYIYIYIIQCCIPTHTWYLTLTCVNIALTHRTAPTHRERGEGDGERIPTTYTHLYTYCICNHVYIYCIYIYPLLTYLPHNGGGGDHWYLYTYMSSYISIYSLSLHLGIITTFVLYMITYPYRPHGSVDVQYSPMGIYDHLFTGGRGSHILTYPRSYIPTSTHP